MPHQNLSDFFVLPELKIIKEQRVNKREIRLLCLKTHLGAVCTHCAQFSKSTYDRRRVLIKDSPVREFKIRLEVIKRRYWCKRCQRAFTESIPGILPKRRSTQRFRKLIQRACENFCDRKKVRTQFGCSNDFVFKAHYEALELRRRKNNQYPWPKKLGIDEHHFRRVKGPFAHHDFVTMLVDHNRKKLFEVCHGKSKVGLMQSLAHIPGRENVQQVTMDMCDPYRNFIKEFFPNAEIVSDKFHILRLLNPAINRVRKNYTGDKRSNPVRKLLIRNSKKLEFFQRSALHKYLEDKKDLRELYFYKEALHKLYRIKGYNRAKKAFIKLLDQMALSQNKEIKRLRGSLKRWFNEILNYFKFRITNARTEGFNNVAKVIKRRAYGFKNFENYRLMLLSACS